MQTVTKKSVTKAPDIASVPVPDTLAALHVNPERGVVRKYSVRAPTH
jgi:hypothetical protein